MDEVARSSRHDSDLLADGIKTPEELRSDVADPSVKIWVVAE